MSRITAARTMGHSRTDPDDDGFSSPFPEDKQVACPACPGNGDRCAVCDSYGWVYADEATEEAR